MDNELTSNNGYRKNINDSGTVYDIKNIAGLTGKSKNLVYRRLTERPRRYTVRFARKEGARWVFDRKKVDEAISRDESLIVPNDCLNVIDDKTAIDYFLGESGSCGRNQL